MGLDVSGVRDKLFELAREYSQELSRCLGEDLISVVLYGSVARREATPTSDVDLLIVATGLPKGQFRRKELLAPADEAIAPAMEALSKGGIDTAFSRIVKTPQEASRIVPLYLDMVEDAILLLDRDDFFREVLGGLRERLKRMGARRVRSGRIRYWDLKPDLKPFERFSI